MSSPGEKPFRMPLPVLFGAAGGTINALLLWLHIPQRVADFEPVILACGALHGAALAACAIVGARLVLRHPRLSPLVLLLTGYLAGWISWAPTHHLISDKPLLTALVWPFTLDNPSEALWRPFQQFGLVALVLAAGLAAARRSSGAMVGFAVASGILGSLWFWISVESGAHLWYLSPLHGAIWGLLAGAGIRSSVIDEFS